MAVHYEPPVLKKDPRLRYSRRCEPREFLSFTFALFIYRARFALRAGHLISDDVRIFYKSQICDRGIGFLAREYRDNGGEGTMDEERERSSDCKTRAGNNHVGIVCGIKEAGLRRYKHNRRRASLVVTMNSLVSWWTRLFLVYGSVAKNHAACLEAERCPNVS